MSVSSSGAGYLSLISIMGLVPIALVQAFVEHYRNLGVSDFFLGFHFREEDDHVARANLLQSVSQIDGVRVQHEVGEWRENTNGDFRDRLRALAGGSWHVIADADEFQFHPLSIMDSIRAADDLGEVTVQGLLFDRVSADGSLVDLQNEVALDELFPLGGFFTHHVLGGDSRKVLVVRSAVDLGSGNHRALSAHSQQSKGQLLPVHHFKWTAGVDRYLKQRIEGFGGITTGAEQSMAHECGLALAHLAEHGGRIDVHDPSVRFMPAGLEAFPPGWLQRSRDVAEYWWVKRWERGAAHE